MSINRRPLIATLVGLPVVSLVADWMAQGQKPTWTKSTDGPAPPDTPEFRHFSRGIKTLRIINTAFARHRHTFGAYPGIAELTISPLSRNG